MSHTIAIDRMGVIHIWQGQQSPIHVGKYQFAPEADVYLQDQADVLYVLDSLDADTVDSLQNGYIVCVDGSELLMEVCNGQDARYAR